MKRKIHLHYIMTLSEFYQNDSIQTDVIELMLHLTQGRRWRSGEQ